MATSPTPNPSSPTSPCFSPAPSLFLWMDFFFPCLNTEHMRVEQPVGFGCFDSVITQLCCGTLVFWPTVLLETRESDLLAPRE